MTDTRLTTTERFLRLFTEVRPGEGRTAMLMFVNVFLTFRGSGEPVSAAPAAVPAK